MKLKWAKRCVLVTGSVDNTNADPNSIIFTITDTNLYVHIVTLLAKDNQSLSKFLIKGFQRSVYWNQYKIKHENKNKPNEHRCFLE